MKLATFDEDRIGVVRDRRIFDVTEALGPEILSLRPRYRMGTVIAEFKQLSTRFEALAVGPGIPLDAVRLRAPVRHPGLILATTANFRHGRTYGRTMPSWEVKPQAALAADGAKISLPKMELGAVHHQAELAVVIGKPGRDISVEAAADHIFGYSCAINLSARGIMDNQGVAVTGHEGFACLGPYIVTADEVADPQALQVRLWQGKALRQDYSTADMEFSVVELIAFASALTAFEAGDIITCGTDYRGIGPVQDGEHYVVEIESVGRLSLFVEDPLSRRWTAAVDSRAAEILDAARLAGIPADPRMSYTPQIESGEPRT